MRKLSLAGAVMAAVALVALALVTIQSAAPTANAQILPPSRFYGTVTVDGSAATAGTVRGKVGGNICGTATISDLGGGLNYDIQVKHSSEQTGCGSDNASVAFEYVDGGNAIACWRQDRPRSGTLWRIARYFRGLRGDGTSLEGGGRQKRVRLE